MLEQERKSQESVIGDVVVFLADGFEESNERRACVSIQTLSKKESIKPTSSSITPLMKEPKRRRGPFLARNQSTALRYLNFTSKIVDGITTPRGLTALLFRYRSGIGGAVVSLLYSVPCSLYVSVLVENWRRYRSEAVLKRGMYTPIYCVYNLRPVREP